MTTEKDARGWMRGCLSLRYVQLTLNYFATYSAGSCLRRFSTLGRSWMTM